MTEDKIIVYVNSSGKEVLASHLSFEEIQDVDEEKKTYQLQIKDKNWEVETGDYLILVDDWFIVSTGDEFNSVYKPIKEASQEQAENFMAKLIQGMLG